MSTICSSSIFFKNSSKPSKDAIQEEAKKNIGHFELPMKKKEINSEDRVGFFKLVCKTCPILVIELACQKVVTFKLAIKMHRVKSSRLCVISPGRFSDELAAHAILLSLWHGFDEQYAVLK